MHERHSLKQGLFWLMVTQFLVHGQPVPLFLDFWKGKTSQKGMAEENSLMAIRKQRGEIRRCQGLQRHPQ
jgi:hypothetical protein